MNEKPRCSLIRGRSLEGVPTRDVAAPAPPAKPQDASSRSTENERIMQCSYSKNNSASEGDSMLVVIDSSSLSDPSSTEMVVDQQSIPKEPCRTYFNRNEFPSVLPSTSKGQGNDTILKRESVSKEELPMIEINLSSDQEISLDNMESDSESVVLSYLRNKDLFSDMEGTLVSTKKKSSLLEGVPKLETIQEGENFFSFSSQQNELLTPISEISPDIVHTKFDEKKQQLSDNSLERLFPSYPATPELVSQYSSTSEDAYADAVQRLHEDHDFLLAAETGNEALLKIMLSKKGNKDIQRIDMLGRNALHLAVCSGNVAAIKLLLKAGVNPNVKDDIGMTPLSLCLMRSRSLEITKLLFDHGATIIRRSSPMDTGLFLQFVIMSTPTMEEIQIMKLLVSKGAMIDDPDAPGGRQALHFAAMSNNPRLIKVLVAMGADPFLTNDRGETPREIAILFQCKEALRVLEQIEESTMYNTIISSESSGSDGSGKKIVEVSIPTTATKANTSPTTNTPLITSTPPTSTTSTSTSTPHQEHSSPSSHGESSTFDNTGTTVISWKDRIAFLD